MKYKDDTEKLKASLLNTLPVRGVTCEAVADCVGERRLRQFIPKEKGEKVHMCKAIDMLIADGEKRGIEIGEKRERKNTERERKNAERERKNAERERIRAERAEARVRELEEKLKAL